MVGRYKKTAQKAAEYLDLSLIHLSNVETHAKQPFLEKSCLKKLLHKKPLGRFILPRVHRILLFRVQTNSIAAR